MWLLLHAKLQKIQISLEFLKFTVYCHGLKGLSDPAKTEGCPCLKHQQQTRTSGCVEGRTQVESRFCTKTNQPCDVTMVTCVTES